MTDIHIDNTVLIAAASVVATAIGLSYLRKAKSSLDLIPGDRGLPLIGITNITRMLEQEWVIEAHKKYGDVFVTRAFGSETVNVCDPVNAYNVLRDTENFGDRPGDGFTYFLPKGLLGLPLGEEWKHHRKSISPLFAERFLKEYSKDIVSTIDEMLDHWEEKIQKNPIIDISEQLTQVTLDIIGKTGFGIDFHALDGKTSEYEQAGKDLLKGVLIRSISSNFVWKSLFGGVEKSSKSAIQTWKQACDLAKERSNKIEEKSMISAILNDNTLGEKEVLDEMITLLLAGHETTGNTVTFVCYLLAKHPEIQKKVQEEIDSIYSLDTFDEENIYDQIHQNAFPYIKAVVYECLRVIPTVPFLPRTTSKEVILGGYVIPEGVKIGVRLPAVNMGSQWEDPFTFKPERFIGIENEAHFFKEMGFAPFGAGPRVCIGQRFAQLEAIILIAKIFRRYSIELKSQDQQKIETTSNITQSPKGGLPLKVSLRN